MKSESRIAGSAVCSQSFMSGRQSTYDISMNSIRGYSASACVRAWGFKRRGNPTQFIGLRNAAVFGQLYVPGRSNSGGSRPPVLFFWCKYALRLSKRVYPRIYLNACGALCEMHQNMGSNMISILKYRHTRQKHFELSSVNAALMHALGAPLLSNVEYAED